jgi:SAM-dependent methyltransferase
MPVDFDAVRRAEAALRPGAADAIAAWGVLVKAEREQTESLPNRPRPEDFYAPIAQAFRDDPHRKDDPLLELLRPLARPDETWLDLGAGGGRYTVPLALAVSRVYAVEPSAGMREQLAAAIHEHNIGNIDTFAERWPSPTSAVPIADVGFMSQVGYDIEDIGPFVDQLEAHTRRMCAVMLYDNTPLRYFAPLWPLVHGEPRVALPALYEFVALLYARGQAPAVTTITLPQRGFEDVEALHRASRRPLWVLPDTPEDGRLGRAARELALPVEGGVGLSSRRRALGIVTWEPHANEERPG